MDYGKLTQSELEVEATKQGLVNTGDRDALLERLQQNDGDSDDDAELDGLTKAELQSLADGRNIDYAASDTKADLIELLEEGE